MANIDKELLEIRIGRWGEEIRMPIHDALKKIADETPKPKEFPDKCFMVSQEVDFIVDHEGWYLVSNEPNWFNVIDYEADIMVSSDGYEIVAYE